MKIKYIIDAKTANEKGRRRGTSVNYCIYDESIFT